MRLVLIYTVLAALMVACRSNNAAPAGMFNLSKLQGAWEFHHEGTHEITEWLPDDSGNLKGKGYLLYNTDTVYIEFLNIKKEGNNLTYYVSVGGGKNSERVPYTLVKQSENSLEFFNKDYPFPQRIVYNLTNDTTIVNYIEGMQEGQMVRKNFIYQKKKV
jgi:hypothetical protein